MVQKEDMQSTPAASQTDKDEDEEEGEVKMSDLEKFLPMLKQTGGCLSTLLVTYPANYLDEVSNLARPL